MNISSNSEVNYKIGNLFRLQTFIIMFSLNNKTIISIILQSRTIIIHIHS